ncbi:MAG: hypothetical protein LWW81_00170, partial [Rhodocyclales bacterium]|nr:hypothetical protein [Rhodocyclales bacterium]
AHRLPKGNRNPGTGPRNRLKSGFQAPQGISNVRFMSVRVRCRRRQGKIQRPVKDSFTHMQFLTAITLIPLGTTLAEAYSPHTWDTPFIYGVAGFSIFCILNYV